MNRPPLPITLSAKRTRRPEQNLTSLALGSRGAVLLPVIPKIQQSQSWILVKRTDALGENGKNFIPHFILLKFLHPPHWPSRRKQIPIANREARNTRKIKHQNGRERPHFSVLKPPKKYLRSLPPIFGIRQQARFARKGSSPIAADRPQSFTHDELHEFCITACMAGPQEGETQQCQS